MHEKDCDGKGKYQTTSGGLACYQCWLSRKSNGNGNPSRWITKCYYEMIKVEERRNHSTITTTDFKDIKSFHHNDKSRFTPEGLILYNENINIQDNIKEAIVLNYQIKKQKEIVLEENVNLVDIFFEKAANLCKKNNSFKNNVIVCLLCAMVVK